MRTILFYLLLISALLFAYVAGLVSYPVVQPLLGSAIQPLLGEVATPTPLINSADPVDMSVFWEVWQLLDRDFYGEKPAGTERSYGAIRGLVEKFGDPYTRFEEPVTTTATGAALCGCFGGIGATIEQTDDGFILHPLPDQPAALAGILDGDRLIQVDETVITLGLSIDEVVALVKGEVDSNVEITVQRAVSEPTTAVNIANANGTPTPALSQLETLRFVIKRVELKTPSLQWRLLDDDPKTATIGYMRHTQFTVNSADEMRTALQELHAAGAARYLLDLRGNPGGPVDAALQMADMWIDDGLLLIEEHANGEQERFEAHAGTDVETAPLVVLVDAGSASASEILAGALQDHRRATLVGEQTYGKGSVQLRYELADKSSLFVTNAQWFTPDHHKIAGTGLTPDIVVEQGADALAVAIESVLQIK